MSQSDYILAYPWIDHAINGGWGTIALALIVACFARVLYLGLRNR